MGIQKLDKSKWIDVCAALSIGLLGKRAEIEVVSPIDGILIEAHWLPVFGIAYDPAKDELKIRLDGVDHSVLQPMEMYLDLGFGGVQSLGILDNAKAWQIVLLRDPLMLPRPANDECATANSTIHYGGNVMNRDKHQVEGLEGKSVNADRFTVQRLQRQRHGILLPTMAVAICAAIGLAPQIVRSDEVVVDVVAVAQGTRTGDIKGKPVVNEKSERIGTVEDLIVGQDRVLFAILQVGGFLGIGSHFVAVPYQSLQISAGANKILLPGASKEALQGLPEFKYRV